jgi:hypothetical protein
MCLYHRLCNNRPTKRGKEKSPSYKHCQCEKEMDDYLLACQQFLIESHIVTHLANERTSFLNMNDINDNSLMFYSVSVNANSVHFIFLRYSFLHYYLRTVSIVKIYRSIPQSYFINIIISPLMTPLLGHKPSLWITHKESGP